MTTPGEEWLSLLVESTDSGPWWDRGSGKLRMLTKQEISILNREVSGVVGYLRRGRLYRELKEGRTGIRVTAPAMAMIKKAQPSLWGEV